MKEVLNSVKKFVVNYGDVVFASVMLVVFIVSPKESIGNIVGGIGIISGVAWMVLKRILDVKSLKELRDLKK